VPVGAALLLIGAGPRTWFNRVVLSHPLAVWFGLISYPLYLWHWPLLSFAQIVESHQPAPWIRAAAILFAVVLAWLSWLLLELPLRRFAVRRGTAAVTLLCGLMAGMVLAGGWLFQQGGLPQRSSVQDNLANQKALEIVEDKDNAAACKQRYGFASMYDYCLLAWPERDPTVALIGDSHAYHVVAGLTAYYKRQGDNLLFLGTAVPYLGLTPPPGALYQEATQAMLERALAMPSVRTVVFSTHRHFISTPDGKALVDAARETYRRFIAAGKRVIVIEDVPIMPFDPRSCIKRAGVASSATTSPCGIPRADWDRQIADHEKVRAQLERDLPGHRRRHLRPADRQFPERGRAPPADHAQRESTTTSRTRTASRCRIPDRYNLMVPRSACPHCGHQITALENIPVVSWLALRGKCSKCKAPISARYPAVELRQRHPVGLLVWHFGSGWPGLATLVFAWLLIAMT
jgi:hypothetical protein